MAQLVLRGENCSERTEEEGCVKSFDILPGDLCQVHVESCAVDCGPGEEGCQKKVKGGAVQLVLQKVSFDSYPYHRAGTACTAYSDR